MEVGNCKVFSQMRTKKRGVECRQLRSHGTTREGQCEGASSITDREEHWSGTAHYLKVGVARCYDPERKRGEKKATAVGKGEAKAGAVAGCEITGLVLSSCLREFVRNRKKKGTQRKGDGFIWGGG